MHENYIEFEKLEEIDKEVVRKQVKQSLNVKFIDEAFLYKYKCLISKDRKVCIDLIPLRKEEKKNEQKFKKKKKSD